tara:strand:- start:2844 stop:3092 length:249 start_codon:yes stop_codon:yes gene_type:complete
MPRYNYRCEACEAQFLAMHSVDEILENCKLCESVKSLTKLLTMPSYALKQTKTKKVGQVTQDFIDEARHDLKKQKKDLTKEK